MPPPGGRGYAKVGAPPRDSLELASLASSEPSRISSRSSSPAGISSSRKLSLEDDDPLSTGPLPHHDAPRPRHSDRTYSMSSTFDFSSNLFPLSSTAAGYTSLGTPIEESHGGPDLEKHKTLTYLNGLSLVVGIIIGSGIFSSPSQVSMNTGSPGAALLVWAIAGVLAWTGAASYAELGGAIPLNGGSQMYLAKIYADWMGFLFTWSSVLVIKPGATAIIAIIFGEYVARAVVGADAFDLSVWLNKGIALAGLGLVVTLNCISTRLATRMGDVFMVMKFVALLAVTVIGIVVAVTGFSYHNANIAKEWKNQDWFSGTSNSLSNWAVALYAGLWAYDGWDNTNYVAGEFRNPAKDLPRVLHTAMPLVILSYILANLSYIFVLPTTVITSTNTVAVQFGSAVFGPLGALAFAIVVSFSCFGALNATTFTSGRLVYSGGKEGYLPSILGKIGLHGADRFGGAGVGRGKIRSGVWGRFKDWISDEDGAIGYTPINAMVFNGVLTTCYVIIGEFRTLLTFTGVAGYTYYFLTVLGLIVLRVREPDLPRPYKTWITTPVIFCCVSLFLLSRAVVAEPFQTLIVLAFNLAGVPVYFWRVHGRGGRKGQSGWKFWQRWTG